MNFPLIMNDIFYKADRLSIETRVDIINHAFVVKNNWHVDKLDCSVSWARQRIKMSFAEIMKKFGKGCHFVIIHRFDSIDGEYGEVGFSTMSGKESYYLWIFLTVVELDKLVKQYKLQKTTY